MKLKSNSHSRGEASYHLVFCPKYRHKIFSYQLLRNFCERLIYQIAECYGFEIRALEIMLDHLHLFVSVPPRLSISDVLHAIRGTTGFRFFQTFPWLAEKKPGEMRFWGKKFWSRGYFYRSVGSTTDEAVEFYIKVSQTKHLREKYYSLGRARDTPRCSEDPYIEFLKGNLRFDPNEIGERRGNRTNVPKGQLTLAAFL